MNERIIKIGLESGMLNYVDNETPRHYFLSGHADEQDLAKFAQLIAFDTIKDCRDQFVVNSVSWNLLNDKLKHFGVEE